MQYASFFMSSFHTTTLFRINGEAGHKQKSLKSEELSNFNLQTIKLYTEVYIVVANCYSKVECVSG